MREPEGFRFANGEAVALTTASPAKDPGANEDAVGCFPVLAGGGLLAVADGVGGHVAGAAAAKTTLECLWDAVLESPPDADHLRVAVLDAIDEANRRIRADGQGSATTVVAVELRGRELRPYHVGDSAALVVGQRGRIRLQTVAHSPVGYALEAGLLDEEEALHHEHRHVISNAVGMPEMRIEVGAVLKLAPRDTVLLASDGLFDNLPVAEIVDIIRTGPLLDAARTLARISAERMQGHLAGGPSKPDDLSLVLFRLAPSPRANA